MDSLRVTTHRAQRAFLIVNAVPFAVSIVLSCFTDVPAVAVYGEFTLGLAWGIAQCALFVASAWLCDMRITQKSEPAEDFLASDVQRTEMSGVVPIDGFRRWDQ
ncbi:hypothetical protein C6376_41265 [Streptomyces sp. P3]|jgi:hypothetical protein|uniref:hypothetical protein n=1 Tax=unclassified Streptomyces TaxID=2593676 RepID=UPI000D1AB7CD|nr:hypothetical protein [Streptomyces sp. P3]AVV46801.1 hypothetical protein C6376_41265 [Streptomyces sp. P3]